MRGFATPIPEAAGGNDTARLVDTPEVFSAAYVQDFAIDGDMSKKVWRNAPSIPAPTGATMDDIEEAKLPEFYKMFVVIDGVFRDPKRGLPCPPQSPRRRRCWMPSKISSSRTIRRMSMHGVWQSVVQSTS